MSAEYILAEGNGQVILCERGIRSFDTMTRNLFDLTAVPLVQRLSHSADDRGPEPRHGTARQGDPDGARGDRRRRRRGDRRGASDPDRALSDGAQSLYPDQFARLVTELRAISAAIGRSVASTGTPATAGV